MVVLEMARSGGEFVRIYDGEIFEYREGVIMSLNNIFFIKILFKCYQN
jgi:hypothetical protein